MCRVTMCQSFVHQLSSASLQKVYGRLLDRALLGKPNSTLGWPRRTHAHVSTTQKAHAFVGTRAEARGWSRDDVRQIPRAAPEVLRSRGRQRKSDHARRWSWPGWPSSIHSALPSLCEAAHSPCYTCGARSHTHHHPRGETSSTAAAYSSLRTSATQCARARKAMELAWLALEYHHSALPSMCEAAHSPCYTIYR